MGTLIWLNKYMLQLSAPASQQPDTCLWGTWSMPGSFPAAVIVSSTFLASASVTMSWATHWKHPHILTSVWKYRIVLSIFFTAQLALFLHISAKSHLAYSRIKPLTHGPLNTCILANPWLAGGQNIFWFCFAASSTVPGPKEAFCIYPLFERMARLTNVILISRILSDPWRSLCHLSFLVLFVMPGKWFLGKCLLDEWMNKLPHSDHQRPRYFHQKRKNRAQYIQIQNNNREHPVVQEKSKQRVTDIES